MTHKNLYLSLLCAVALAMVATPSFAGKKVYGPTVSKGEWELETYGYYTFDDRDSRDGAFKEKTAIGYGLTDWWFMELYGIVEKDPGDSTEYSDTEWSNKFELLTEEESGVGFALYAAYELAADRDDPDTIEGKLIFGKHIGPTENYANITIERQVGNNSSDEWEAAIALRSVMEIADDLEGGFEYYAAFGEIGDAGSWDDQNHQFGPILAYEIEGHPEAEIQIGYLFGISDGAPDGMLTWRLELEF